MAQERRRGKHGRETSQRRGRDDGRELQEIREMEEHVLVPDQCTQHVKIWRGKQAERLTKRTKTNWEEGQAQRERGDGGPDGRRCTNKNNELELEQ